MQSTVRIPAPGEDRIECGGVVRAAVADHELHLVCLLAEVHHQVAGLLGGPLPGRMQSDPENADAPAGGLDHGQDISPGTIEQVGREEVARQDRLGLGAQEQRPAWPGPPRRRVDPSILQVSHTVGAATFTPRSASDLQSYGVIMSSRPDGRYRH